MKGGEKMIDFVCSIKFITGLFAGAFIGVSFLAIVVAGHRADERLKEIKMK